MTYAEAQAMWIAFASGCYAVDCDLPESEVARKFAAHHPTAHSVRCNPEVIDAPIFRRSVAHVEATS